MKTMNELGRHSLKVGLIVSQWVLNIGTCAGVLWFVALRAHPGPGHVVLHLTEPDIEVTLGPIQFESQAPLLSPLSVTLNPGHYALVVRRGESILMQEEFQLASGEHRVFTAYSPPPKPQQVPNSSREASRDDLE